MTARFEDSCLEDEHDGREPGEDGEADDNGIADWADASEQSQRFAELVL